MLFPVLPLMMRTWICTFTCVPIKEWTFLKYKQIKFACVYCYLEIVFRSDWKHQESKMLFAVKDQAGFW